MGGSSVIQERGCWAPSMPKFPKPAEAAPGPGATETRAALHVRSQKIPISAQPRGPEPGQSIRGSEQNPGMTFRVPKAGKHLKDQRVQAEFPAQRARLCLEFGDEGTHPASSGMAGTALQRFGFAVPFFRGERPLLPSLSLLWEWLWLEKRVQPPI